MTLVSQYDRYGYRPITALIERTGWQVGKDQVERIFTPGSGVLSG